MTSDGLDIKKDIIESNISWVEYSEKKSREQASSEIKQEVATTTIMMFQVEREFYGIPIDSVKEVVKSPQISKIPQTEDHIVGVGNIRGNVLAIINPQIKIRKTHDEIDYAFLIVFDDDEIQAGVLTEKIPDAIVVENTQINRSSPAIQNLTEEENYITGLIKHKDKMIFLIDIQKML
ncbi:MAG: chemotaxis protein CheW [Cyclobacteriaceae bacterium]